MSTPFLFIAGHSALDFLNTEQANSAGERVELLNTPEDVSAWGEAAGFGNIAVADAILTEARGLRDAVRALVQAWTADAPAPAEPLAYLNAILATGAARPVMRDSFVPASEPVAGIVPHPLLPVALSALDLLTRHDKTLVRPCAGTGCVLWFLDTTKNKRRRWCRMEACGNREKVAAHTARAKQAQAEA